MLDLLNKPILEQLRAMHDANPERNVGEYCDPMIFGQLLATAEKSHRLRDELENVVEAADMARAPSDIVDPARKLLDGDE